MIANLRDNIRAMFDLERLGVQIDQMYLVTRPNDWQSMKETRFRFDLVFDLLQADWDRVATHLWEDGSPGRLIYFVVRKLREGENLWECHHLRAAIDAGNYQASVNNRDNAAMETDNTAADAQTSQASVDGGGIVALEADNAAVENGGNTLESTNNDIVVKRGISGPIGSAGDGRDQDIAEAEITWKVEKSSEKTTTTKKGDNWKVVKTRKKEMSRDKAGKWEKVKIWEEVTTFRKVDIADEEGVEPALQTPPASN